ncbi:hypothetical protein [Ruegeria arenilitoris]|uniref:hypothetical protein n=1 Tax=Ruegeria arenilitoris TaxID=1173585 RepID=UPI001479DD5A|nr:hypothetical protein [Ruegeria arenilitoris]
MTKKFTILSGVLLIALICYLPFELNECDEMMKEHGDVFICLPITFVAIPVFAVVFLVLLALLLRSKRRMQ